MGEALETLSEEGFQFFGKVTASVTHEIKNALAVIRENAGLMEDLISMGERKGGLDPARIQALAGKIGKQAMKADGIVQNMNRFAHSMDEPVAELDLGDTLRLLAALSGRIAAMHGVVFETRVPDAPVRLKTNPFFMETLLWGCLEFAMVAAGPEKRLALVLEEVETGARIRVTGVRVAEEVEGPEFPPERHNDLHRVLGAEVRLAPSRDEIIIELPKVACL
ncbi:MAG: sensor histidine kinase [Deltaproteobacteria bacterium]|nr:sensor histidine kinase [Deltaproteobacteria bacterium]